MLYSQVKALERQFRQASDFRLATGQGILEKAAAEDEENREEALKLAEKSVEETIMNYCPYYFELAEVMADCMPKSSTPREPPPALLAATQAAHGATASAA
ncbi:hypothetical protein OC834_006646 [Tilletia horrida]|uniref:Uncharacterized protein n=1 Tax=Tilletia horrida TaxID=155126 RepID=A0AAN6JIZ1_9BASI|nr:hypothetical protein OC834_006646 [Tilletia horrida]KAK0527615.1 hypothetical protein OC842_004810 [Tilletia horrida]